MLHHISYAYLEDLESDMGKTCGSGDALSSEEYGCSLEQASLISAETNDSMPNQPGSMSDK